MTRKEPFNKDHVWTLNSENRRTALSPGGTISCLSKTQLGLYPWRIGLPVVYMPSVACQVFAMTARTLEGKFYSGVGGAPAFAVFEYYGGP